MGWRRGSSLALLLTVTGTSLGTLLMPSRNTKPDSTMEMVSFFSFPKLQFHTTISSAYNVFLSLFSATPCEYCPKTFKTRRDAKAHEQRCSSNPDKVKLTCTAVGCSRFFYNRGNLNQHLKEKHPGEQPSTSRKRKRTSFQCPTCATQYFSYGVLVKHMEKKHKDVAVPSREEAQIQDE